MRTAFAGSRSILLLGVLVALVMPSTAAADPPPSSLLGGIPGLLDGTNVAVNKTETNLVGFLTDTACSATTVVTSSAGSLPLLGGILGGVLAPVNTVVCALGFLQFDFHTIYRPPTGPEVVRDTFALPLVPTLMDLTGDGIPDATGTVSLTSVTTVTLSVQKLPTARANLPAQVELIIRNPTDIHSTSRIGAGFDTRDTNMPTKFSAAVALQGFSPLHLGLTVSQTGATTGMNLIGSLFKLSADNTRETSAGARLGFVPAPSTMGYDLLLDSEHQHVTATSNVPSLLTAHVGLLNGNEEQTIDASLDKLPTRADVDIVNQDDAHRAASYSASAPIDKLNATYRDVAHHVGSDELTTEIVGAITSLPKGVTFQQTGAKSATFSTQGGPIGLVEGGFATGQHVLPVAGTESGARIETGGALKSIAGRLRGLSTATVDASGPYTADVQAATQMLHLAMQDNDAGRTIDAKVQDLPAHLALNIDPDHGKVTENGFGQAIAKITADVKSVTPFFARVKHLHADLIGIPAAFNLDFTQANGTFTATLDHPVNEIDVAADDGVHSEAVAGTDSGVIYHDTPDEYAIAGRIFGLALVKVQTEPTIAAEVKTAGGHLFTLAGSIQQQASDPLLTVAGSIQNLPAHVALTMDPATGNITYNGFGEAIAKISADLKSSTPLFARVKHLHADLIGISASFNLDFTHADGSFSASMDHPVNEIDVFADDGVNSELPPGSDSGFLYHDTPNEYAIAGRIYGLSKVSFQSDPLNAQVVTAGGHVFSAVATLIFEGEPLTAATTLDKLPSDISFGMTKTDAGTTVDYKTNSRIDSIEASFNGPAFIPRAHYMYAKILGLPSELHVHLPTDPDGPVFSFDTGTGGQSIDKVQFQALDNNGRSLVEFPVPAGGTSPDVDGVVYHDLLNGDATPKEITIAAQLSGLRGASVQMKPHPHFQLDMDPAKSKILGADIKIQKAHDQDPANPTPPSSDPITYLRGYINKLPPHLDLEVTTDAQKTINYSAGAPIDDIFITTNIGGASAPLMNVRVQHVPKVLNICVATGNDDSKGCIRPRPPGYPQPPNTTEYVNSQFLTGDIDENHIAGLNIDDGGTSPENSPLTLDAFICLQGGAGGDPCIPGVAKKYVQVENLKLHNLMIDAFLDGCGIFTAELCGHLGIDTRNREFSGNISYSDSTSSALNNLEAGLIFPPGFKADYRYTNFKDASLVTGSPNNVLGTVTCPAGTFVGANITLLGGGNIQKDIAGQFFC